MNYQEIINNVNSFYTDGSAAVDYLNSLDLTGEQLGQIIDATDRFDVVRNADGEIINFTQKVDKVIGETSALNSNVGTSTQASVSIPLTSTELQTGKLLIGQGVTGGMTGVQFLAGSVLPAFAAVGSGIALGKAIDSTLYNLNPDFWDAQGMGTLNPETWNTITTNDTALGRVFNMVWGLNPETGTAQPYIDQNALAYLVGYMIQQGVYSTPGINATGYSPTSSYTLRMNWTYPVTLVQDLIIPSQSDPSVIRYRATLTNGNGGIIFVKDPSNTYGTVFLMGRDATFTLQDGQSTTTYTLSNQSGTAWWYGGAMGGYSSNNTYTLEYFSTGTRSDTLNDLIYLFFYNNDVSQGISVEGITDQTGATQFDASGIADPTDINDILSALQTQFPTLFANAVTQPLPQLDPELAPLPDTVYIPIGAPQIDPLHPTQPLGNLATQADPALDPDTFPESAIESATDSMQNPVPDDPNLPPTGTGLAPIAALPEGSANALFSVYNPTQAQVDSFGAWLWSNNFVEQLKKIFNDPMESIISLHKIFATPVTGSSANITVGYLDSGVSAATVTDQYTSVDCGTVTLSEYFRNVFDYTDTAIDLYLPFVGIVQLSADDVMRASINVTYHVDVLTGSCLVEVTVMRDLAGGVIYQYSGDCAVHYPVSSGSYMGIVSGLLSMAGGIAGTVATGGAALPMLMGASGAIMGAHTKVERSGGFSANAGAMGAKKPYLIISRPQTALPETYLTMEGIGSNQSVTLSACTGLVKVKEVQLTGIEALDEELDEIMDLLRGGVIL